MWQPHIYQVGCGFFSFSIYTYNPCHSSLLKPTFLYHVPRNDGYGGARIPDGGKLLLNLLDMPYR